MATVGRWLSVHYTHRGQEEPDQPDNSWDPDDFFGPGSASWGQWKWEDWSGSSVSDSTGLWVASPHPEGLSGSHRLVNPPDDGMLQRYGSPYPTADIYDEPVPSAAALENGPWIKLATGYTYAVTVHVRPTNVDAWDEYFGRLPEYEGHPVDHYRGRVGYSLMALWVKFRPEYVADNGVATRQGGGSIYVYHPSSVAAGMDVNADYWEKYPWSDGKDGWATTKFITDLNPLPYPSNVFYTDYAYLSFQWSPAFRWPEYPWVGHPLGPLYPPEPGPMQNIHYAFEIRKAVGIG